MKATRVRINIYVPGLAIRRQIKTAAARRDLTVSEYCLRSITAQLDREVEGAPREASRLKAASSPVVRARRFQASAFGRRVFSVSSAELIREDRARRGANG